MPKIDLAITTAIMLGLLLFFAFSAVRASDQPNPKKPSVHLRETDNLFILDNGIVAATIAKASGDIVSLKYKGKEMFATLMASDGKPDLIADPPGENLGGLNPGMTDHQYGFWSHDAMGQRKSHIAPVTGITINPEDNGGNRAEVSVKGYSNGTRKMGTGPGAAKGEGDFYADVEIRYTMGRGESGVYTYCIFEHKPEYPADGMTEARFCMKLNDFFDWILIDTKRNKYYPKTHRENKYNYTANQFDNRAFGWASTTESIGCFLINPSMEYMSGGPTKIEFLCHRDTNDVAAPCVLNYWRSSHYGGAFVSVEKGEHWTKVIGPFLLYCNSGADPQEIYQDAKAQQIHESSKWPFPWVKRVDYPDRNGRGSVRGQLILNDPLIDNTIADRIWMGLAHSPYDIMVTFPRRQPMKWSITWQNDAKYDQFWVQGDNRGRFAINHVRPGNYTLYAVADGVLGEFVKSDIRIEAGKTIDLGNLEWTPVRHGRQVWEIGIPNRSGREFFKGDDYFHNGMALEYAKRFPNGIHYVIGKSDFTKDWYYAHVPHAEDLNVEVSFFNPGGDGKAGIRSIEFDLPAPPRGTATLRLAICGTGAREIAAAMNDQAIGKIDRLKRDGTIARNGISGIWYERKLVFDAGCMKAGTNVMTLTVPAGSVAAGIIYDYLRLELDEDPT